MRRGKLGPRRGKRRTTYFMDSQESAGTPQVCVLLISIALIAFGIYTLVQSTSHTHERIAQLYLDKLGNWSKAREEFSLSTFTIKYDIDNGEAEEMQLMMDERDDKFSSIVEANHLEEYKNMKFWSGNSLPNGTIPTPVFQNNNNPRLGLEIHATSPTGETTAIDLGSYGVGRLKHVHAETPSPQTKCSAHQHGVLNLGTGKCDVYSRLYYVCVQVKLDAAGKWQLHSPTGREEEFGCASVTHWDPTTFKRLTPTQRQAQSDQIISFKDSNFDRIQVHVRHGDDPFFYVESVTQDTLRFGPESGDMRKLAWVLLAIGFIMAIPPLCLFVPLCCGKGKEEEYARLGTDRGGAPMYNHTDVGTSSYEDDQEDEIDELLDGIELTTRK
ncbi:hypothetical protein TrVE_jg12479 [Triparma verrucosa]|uniref:Uncharacterized protein n=1 Tax=Triparma verrucosa TaxID=1606542 RepID=A0A9W7BB61_9STRA|nr:hypothetical protein TrVE_jg12479 [Triparma verrucosa]